MTGRRFGRAAVVAILVGAAVLGGSVRTARAGGAGRFNGVEAAITSANASQIVTTVPAGATTGFVTVATPAGTATSAAPFTVT